MDLAAGIGVFSSTRLKSDVGVLKSEGVVAGGESSDALFFRKRAKFLGIGVVTS